MTQGVMDFEATETKLSRQQGLILEALRSGPKTNVELSDIALRFGGRIHELKKAGYDIDIVNRGRHGVVTYAISGCGCFR